MEGIRRGVTTSASGPRRSFVALLRAVNVGGQNLVAMPALRALAEGLGLGAPRTLLQSGNLVFEGEGDPAALEARLEAATAERLGPRVDFLVRSAEAWAAILAACAFPEAARVDPSHTLVMCLKAAPEPERVEALRRAIQGREQVACAGREAYFVYPDGIGRSKLTTAVIERALGTRGTARNWNTAQKIAALASVT
jgi:uncharacterized protein (DUF1697 family)